MTPATKCLRSPLGITPRVLEWESRAILDLWPSPIVDLWRFWFLECLVVYCNVSLPISPELGKLFLKNTNVLDRKFPIYYWYLWEWVRVLSWDTCLGLESQLLSGFLLVFFCMVRLEQKPQWLPCILRFLNVNGLTQFTPMDMTLSFWLRNLLNQNMQSA